jgi:16S rRNA (uracil1498-N3)-methyltransferase
MQLFFQKSITFPITYLNEEESKHLVRVLRKKKGDQILLTDGKGMLYTCVLEETDPKKASLKVLSTTEAAADPYCIHLAIAPTKNPERMEWMVEKITEIGFHELTLLETQHGERSFLKLDRLEKKMIAACKQSLQTRFPLLHPSCKFKELVSSPSFQDYQKFIAYLDETQTQHLMDLVLPQGKYLVLIGPEGDFDPKEITWAKSHGFLPVSLGKNRLRTETAGLAAVHLLALVNR